MRGVGMDFERYGSRGKTIVWGILLLMFVTAVGLGGAWLIWDTYLDEGFARVVETLLP